MRVEIDLMVKGDVAKLVLDGDFEMVEEDAEPVCKVRRALLFKGEGEAMSMTLGQIVVAGP